MFILSYNQANVNSISLIKEIIVSLNQYCITDHRVKY